MARVLVQLPEDIEWHFVGHLQSNKAKTLLCMNSCSLLLFCLKVERKDFATSSPRITFVSLSMKKMTCVLK